MSAALHLATEDDLDRLVRMIEADLGARGAPIDAGSIADATLPLLDGSPHGCIYLIGPRNAPIGYLTMTFGWSLEAGGMSSSVDAFYIRQGVRGRGVGLEVLLSILPQLQAAGVKAFTLKVDATAPGIRRLFEKAGFKAQDGTLTMTRQASGR